MSWWLDFQFLLHGLWNHYIGVQCAFDITGAVYDLLFFHIQPNECFLHQNVALSPCAADFLVDLLHLTEKTWDPHSRTSRACNERDSASQLRPLLPQQDPPGLRRSPSSLGWPINFPGVAWCQQDTLSPTPTPPHHPAYPHTLTNHKSQSMQRIQPCIEKYIGMYISTSTSLAKIYGKMELWHKMLIMISSPDEIWKKHLQSDWAQGVLQIIFDIEHIEQNALSLEFSFNLDYPVLPGSVNILKWTLFRSPSSSKSLKYDFPMFILNWTWSLLFVEIVNILTVHG